MPENNRVNLRLILATAVAGLMSATVEAQNNSPNP